ncbi:recombinase family protein [Flindersiella endophytica]
MLESVEQAIPAAAAMIPIAWAARVSDKDSQDPTLSLPRQLNRIREALPSNVVIVAHFWDVESGRMDLDKRGHGTDHTAFDIKVPRDGGVQDLLSEAKDANRRFVAVVCESVDRIARVTYFGTKIEYELEQAGVPLLALDEGVSPEQLSQALQGMGSSRPRKAGTVLTRRMKQVISEWYVLNMLELSWGGSVEHTKQGWNIGKPPYGYKAAKVPHPVPARRAEGRTKHRLVPDPVTGPVVTYIFALRAGERLGYDDIAERLNADPDRYPPPVPPDPARARGRWTWSSVRELLHNPKYTGYMVWNRRARKKGGRNNPPSEWTWSPQPVHEPLVTREQFEKAAEIAKERERTRTGTAANAHPDTRYTYLLRSYVVHEDCGRRMYGKTERCNDKYTYPYFLCYRKTQRDTGKAWAEEHPTCVRVREKALNDAVHEFFATRVFGPERQQLFADALKAVTHDDSAEQERRHRTAALHKLIADIRARQDRVLDEIEDLDDDMDEDTRKAFRQRLRERFADLAKQLKTRQAELEQLAAQPAQTGRQDASLLDRLPTLSKHLSKAPEQLQRDLYDALRLQVVYSHRRKEAHLKVTITDESAETLTTATRATAAGFADLLSAPVTALLEPAWTTGRAGQRAGASPA